MSQAPEQGQSAGPETEEQARQRRMNALRQLAGTSPQMAVVRPESTATVPSGTRTRAEAHTRRPWWLALVAAVLAVALLAGLFLTGHLVPASAGRTTTPVAAVEIAPSGANLLCPQDIAWSPDGSRLAVLGYQRACFDSQGFFQSQQEPAGQLNIYNTRTGKQLSSIKLDPPIISAFPIDQSVSDAFGQIGQTQVHLVLGYSHVVWLPDGMHLAVQFQTFRPTVGPIFQGFGFHFDIVGDTINGVWQGDQQGNDVHLSTHVAANTHVNDTTQPLPTITGWNLSNGNVVPVLPASNAGTPTLALGYAWQPDGTIATQGQFGGTSVPDSVPVGPVGRADDAAFTFWQPGQLAVRVLAPLGDAQTPNGYVFDTTFTALSPDGRYLTAPLEVRGLLEPDGQPPNPLVVSNDHLDGLPRLPIRDAALKAVLDALTRAAADGHDHTATLAWSPDGHELAAQIAPAATLLDASQCPVSLYDTRSGQLLGTVTPLARGASHDLQDQRAVTALRWSSDSTHLMLADTLLGTFTIWGPGQLPHVG